MATEVFLKLATGKTVRVNCEMSDPIGTIKAKIAEQEGVAVAAQRLIFAGKELEDDKTFDEYNVAQESVIYLILRNVEGVDGAARVAGGGGQAAAAATRPLSIKLPSGQTFAIEGITSADTIETVKQRISEQQGINPEHQMLINIEEGREVQNGQTCAGLEVLQLVLAYPNGGGRQMGGGGGSGGGGGGSGGGREQLVVPARFQPALNIYPGPFQDEWNEIYQPVKMECEFEKCLELIVAHPTCVNNRSGGPTGWTLLHQAAYWCAPREIIEALHHAGASPELEGQTFKQMQQGAGCVTPLLVTTDHDDDSKREEWRTMYRDVFGLPQPGQGRGGFSRVTALGMPPAAQSPKLPDGAAAAFQHVVNESDGRVLTLMPKDGKLQWGAQPQLAPVADGTAGQKWRLEGGHLRCEDGGHMLDIDGAEVKQGADIVVWESRDRPNQTWEHTQEGYLVSALNGLCLHANADGTLVTWPQQDEPCQKWRFA